MRVRAVKLRPVVWALRTPFRTALGEKSVTRNVLVGVQTSGNGTGWGEASESLAMPEASQTALLKTLSDAAQYVLNARLSDWEDLSRHLAEKFPSNPTAVSALQCALLDAHCRTKGLPLWKHFGRRKERVETDRTLSALPPARLKNDIARTQRAGFRTVKVKVSGDAAEDAERVTLAARAFPKARLIVDGNQGFSPDGALKFLDRLASGGIRPVLFEQPVARLDLKGLAFVAARAKVPLAADEACRTLEDAERITGLKAARFLNLKLAKNGLTGALDIARFARKNGLKLMLGCMMESPIGLSFPVHWAAGTGIFEYADLDSDLLLEPTGTIGGYKRKGPWLTASDRPGAGSDLKEKNLSC